MKRWMTVKGSVVEEAWIQNRYYIRKSTAAEVGGARRPSQLWLREKEAKKKRERGTVRETGGRILFNA